MSWDLSVLLGMLQDWRLRGVFSSAIEDAYIYPWAVSDPRSTPALCPPPPPAQHQPDPRATCLGPPHAGLAPPSLSRHRQHFALPPACIPLPSSAAWRPREGAETRVKAVAGPGSETWGL